jgi:hypothetical protein
MPPTAWWAGQQVRLAVLLVCLGATVALLLGTRRSVFGAVGIGGGSRRGEGASTWCAPHGLPPPAAAADLEELVALRAVLLRVFTSYGGRWYAGGIVTPEDMWSDDPPLRLRASRLADGL